MSEQLVNADAVKTAGHADPGVQAGLEGAIVRRMGALVAQLLFGLRWGPYGYHLPW